MTSRRSLKLFKKAVKELPAYRSFVLSKDCDPASIRSLDDFHLVPLTSKKEYLQKYPHEQLVWKDQWLGPLAFCSTSGSTGEPYYFPRSDQLAMQASALTEGFLKNSSHGSGRTLVIMGLGMGVWIGGLITLRAFEMAAERMKAPVACIAPGYNKVEIFKILKKLAPEFDQTILVGYPPFIKEIIDDAPDQGIKLKNLNLRLMFAAEAFNETFRNYLCKKAGIRDPLRDTLNIYGTADIGAMAHETPLSILARRLIIENPHLVQRIFGQIEKTPTLAQYNPDFIEFEALDNQLVLTGNSALPLIRYAVGDHGGVVGFRELFNILKEFDIDLEAEARTAGIWPLTLKLPFVFVYERIDLSATLHGLIIYPEFVKTGLQKPRMTTKFTGRFLMSTKTDIRHNQFLQINLELKKGVEATEALTGLALKTITKSLTEKSSEFAEVSKSHQGKELIQLVLWPNGHERYFAPGTKQKWVEKA